MAGKESKPKPVTMQNTKAEMLDAYNEVLQILQEKRAAEIKPQERAEEKKVKEAVQTADTLSTEGIVQGVGALRAEIGRLLGQLSDRLEEEVSRYRQVKLALEAKEREVQDVFEIERSALSLAALIEAQHQRRQQTETELAARQEQLTQEIETTRTAWAAEKATHEAAIQERNTEEQKRRQREQEEYLYTFQREQQLARERFEDERARLEREIISRREQVEEALADRERAVADAETELNTLRQQAAVFPRETEAAVSRAVKEAVQRVETEAKNRDELRKREFDGERNVLHTRIEALEKLVAGQNDQITRLTQQVEKAYGQVQDIAVKAIGGPAHAPAPMPSFDPSRRPAQEA
ncbi:MAG: hypothetical protein IT329_18475 [Caldilineaceae bacterium]|nr:hypothetical protein [Caldilineaceae bacterium]